MTDWQFESDKFYWENGRCCAGCDYWLSEGFIGQCTKSALVAAKDRTALINLENLTLDIGGGHIFTPRDYVCGNFKDGFDWSSLPIFYQKRVGVRKR